MTLFGIAWKNIRHRPLQSGLSIILLAFGVGLISLLALLEVQFKEELDTNIKDIDMVLGAKGSPLQLILANVYHIDAPTGNIKLEDAKRVMKNPLIEQAIPLAYGDNYGLFRIVGSEHTYPEHYNVKVQDGALWEDKYQTTIGSEVAKKMGMKIGDTFFSAHGLNDGTDVHTDKPFTVVGIFEPSGTVIDQLILCSIESVWGVHEHVETAENDHPEDEITAVLLKKRNPMAIVRLPNMIKDTNMQIALPSIEINRINQNFGIGMDSLRWIGIIIVGISLLSLFVSLYSSLRERRYELALMRSMGIKSVSLFILIIMEGLFLALVGLFLGFLLSRCGLATLAYFLENEFKFDLYDAGFLSSELYIGLMAIFVGILASLLPAIEAMSINISKTLSNA
ncbi:MAG: ABC transporter permease [Flavobacteriales bacterium]|nr:ABC transporter permease [Flavobacteriales bacterium]